MDSEGYREQVEQILCVVACSANECHELQSVNSRIP